METKNDAGSSSSLRACELANQKPLDLVISVDTTLSMHGVLQELRGAIDNILQRLIRDTIDLRVAIIAHGDYYDGDDAYVTKCVDFTKDGAKLSHFVRTLDGTSGGDWAECYELVLHIVREELSWRPDSKRIVVMLGDAVPHEVHYPHNLQRIDWREEIKKLRDERKVTVTAIQAYSDTEADYFWRHITSQSGGRLLRLGCFEELVGPMLLALVYNAYDRNLFTAFEDEMLACEPDNRKCRLVRHMFDTLRYDNRHQGDTAYFAPKLMDSNDVKKYGSQSGIQTAREPTDPPLEVVLCIDTAASMVGVTNALRHDIGGLMDRVFSEIKGVRVAVIAHGDYDSTKYSTLYMDFAQNDKPVKAFVQSLQNSNDEPWDETHKCYELALRQIRLLLSWTPHSRRVVIMIGNARPHAPNYALNVDGIDWRNELVVLHQDMEVTIYSIQLHDNQEADSFWYDLAKSTNGRHLRIGKFEKIVSNLIMAIIYKEENVTSFRAYEDEILTYHGTGRRHDTLRQTFNVLYSDDNDSLTSDPAAMRRPHPPKTIRIAQPDTAAPRVGSDGRILEVVLSIDCTMSMAVTVEQLQNSIYDIAVRLLRDIANLRLAIFAHGDYESDAFTSTYVDFTAEVSDLTEFMKGLEPMTGGHEQECYELVLRDVQDKLAWSPGSQRVLIMIGDAAPHEPCHQLNTDAIDWRREIDNLMYQHIRAYSLQLSAEKRNRGATTFWTRLADGTNGVRIELDHSDNMVGLAVMATVYSEQGPEHFKKFEHEVMQDIAELQDPKKVHQLFDTLSGDDGSPDAKQDGAPTGANGPTDDAAVLKVSSLHAIAEEDDETPPRKSESADVSETEISMVSADTSMEQIDADGTDPTKTTSAKFEPVAMEAGDGERIETDGAVVECAKTPAKQRVVQLNPIPGEITDELTSQTLNAGQGNDCQDDLKPCIRGTSKKGGAHVNSGPLDVVFSFDTTLSMIGVIERVRRDIEMITTRLFNNIPDLRLAVFAHGDYDSPNYIIKCLDFTNKADDVNKFVHGMEDTTGGHWQECYELVLQQARENLTWRAGSRRLIIMVGDSSPHEPHYPLNTGNVDYRAEVMYLARDMNVRVYGLQVYNDTEATHFWRYLAEHSGGKHLDVGFTEPLVSVMLLAVVFGEFDKNMLETYAKEVSMEEWVSRRDSIVRRLFEVLGNRSISLPPKSADEPEAKKTKPILKRKQTPAVIDSIPTRSDSFHDELATTRVKDVPPPKKGTKRKAKECEECKPEDVSTEPPPEKKSCLRHPDGAKPRTPRETATLTESLLNALYWTDWIALMQPQRPSDSGSGWLRRQNGVGYRNIRVLSEMNMPAIYEFAVEPPGETVKYPVYLTGTVGFQNIRLDTYFLRQEHLARQINRVLKRGCVLFVRRAKIQKPSRENSAQKTKAQLMKLYDYAWSATTRHGAHRAVELSSKVLISDDNIGTKSHSHRRQRIANDQHCGYAT